MKRGLKAINPIPLNPDLMYSLDEKRIESSCKPE
jgi:hypothetical protein